MKIYIGTRAGTNHGQLNVIVRKLAQDESALSEKPLYHVVRHSPDGFECGYAGNGPLDLALSILADHFVEEHGKIESADFHEMDYDKSHPAILRYHQFMQAFVSRLDYDHFLVNTRQIDEWLAGLGKAEVAGPA